MDLSHLPDENQKRWVIVLNKKVETGRLMNALGHMMAGLMGNYPNAEEMKFLQYEDKSGRKYPNISHYPVIVLKADNSNQVRTLHDKLMQENLPHTAFVETMTVGSSESQLQATKELSSEDHEYFGTCFWSGTDKAKELTKRFSLFK